MALLQIDTIHVVARSPYLVLHARLGDYPTPVAGRRPGAGSHFRNLGPRSLLRPYAADWPLHRACNAGVRSHWGLKHAQAHAAARRETRWRSCCSTLPTTGPVRSADFARPDAASSPWWGWKDEKRWLEALFANGDLMVARRDKFQRVYDLTERVLPAALHDAPLPSPVQVRAHMLEHTVRALGVAKMGWLHDYFRLKPRFSRTELDAAVASGTLLSVAVEGWDGPGYVHADHARLAAAGATRRAAGHAHSAAVALRPVVWDRARALDFFGFDYRLECYTPEAKRRYGYFVLPILCRGELIGRLDAKAHRQEGVLELKSLYAEPGSPWQDAQVEDVAQCVVRFAHWQGLTRVTLAQTQPKRLAAALRRALQAQEEP